MVKKIVAVVAIIAVIIFLVLYLSTASLSYSQSTLTKVSIVQGSSVPGCEETNECYIPYEVTVDVGNEVVWSNDDSAAHTATSGTPGDGSDGFFDSGLFMAGATFSHKFEEEGTYKYFCIVHPWMEGVVLVQKGDVEEDARVSVNDRFAGSELALRDYMVLSTATTDFTKKLQTITRNPTLIQAPISKEIFYVDSSNRQSAITQLIENTVFVKLDKSGSISPENTFTKIDTFYDNPKILSYYKEILTTEQEWPFGNGKKVPLFEIGDQIIEMEWSVNDGTETIKTAAVVDKEGEIKFEPLMYLTPDEIKIGGSHHRLEITNMLGMTVVYADLSSQFFSPDNCSILTDRDKIPHIDARTAPLWTLDVGNPSSEIYTLEHCQNDSTKPVDCTESETTVKYAAFMPNWSISWTEFTTSQSDLPMAAGEVELYTEVVCAPEFPLTAIFILVVTISGIVALMRLKMMPGLSYR